MDLSESLSSPGLIFLYFYAAVIAAPIFEEILYRGFVQSELIRGLGPAGGIFLSALIFSIAHGMLFQSVFTFFVGLVLGWFYYKTKNLFASMIIHIVFNLSSFIAVFYENVSLLTLIISSVIAFALIMSGILILKESMKEHFSASQGAASMPNIWKFPM